MATIEKTGLLKFVGEDGQIYVLYPATKAAQVEGLEELLGTKMSESLSGKYAPLDASGKVVLDYLYTNTANALAKLDASGKLPTDLIPALSAYIVATAKGAANGVASLDANGKLPSGQMTEHNHAYSSLTDIPSTFTPASHSHAASEISGLETYLTGQGYGKVAAGSYVGDGSLSTYANGVYSGGRVITLPFSPAVVILGPESMATTPQKNPYPQVLVQGGYLSWWNSQGYNCGELNGTQMRVSGSVAQGLTYNTSGVTYAWVAIGQ